MSGALIVLGTFIALGVVAYFGADSRDGLDWGPYRSNVTRSPHRPSRRPPELALSSATRPRRVRKPRREKTSPSSTPAGLGKATSSPDLTQSAADGAPAWCRAFEVDQSASLADRSVGVTTACKQAAVHPARRCGDAKRRLVSVVCHGLTSWPSGAVLLVVSRQPMTIAQLASLLGGGPAPDAQQLRVSDRRSAAFLADFAPRTHL
jgi:hypothetical protein